MSLFGAFTPEGLIRALGVDPAQVAQFVGTFQADMKGFKAAFSQAISHFDGKLTRIEARQDAIDAKLDRALALLGDHPPPPALELLSHERNQHDNGARNGRG